MEYKFLFFGLVHVLMTIWAKKKFFFFFQSCEQETFLDNVACSWFFGFFWPVSLLYVAFVKVFLTEW